MLFAALLAVAHAAPQNYRLDIVRYSLVIDPSRLIEAKPVTIVADLSCEEDAQSLTCKNPDGFVHVGISPPGEPAGELVPLEASFDITAPLDEQGLPTRDWVVHFSERPSSSLWTHGMMEIQLSLAMQNLLGALTPAALPEDCQAGLKWKERDGTPLNHVAYQSTLSSIKLKRTVRSCGDTAVVVTDGSAAQAPRFAQSAASELVTVYQISGEVHQKSDGTVTFRRYEHFASRGSLLGSFSLQLQAQ